MRKKKSKKRTVSETPAIRRLGSEVLDVGDMSGGAASPSFGGGHGQGSNSKRFPSSPNLSAFPCVDEPRVQVLTF